MMIDKKLIEKRISELESERANVIAKLQAITGALQDCEYWLHQLKESEKEE